MPGNLLTRTSSEMEADSSGHTMTVRHDAMQVQAKIMVLIRVGSNDSVTKNLCHLLLSEEFETVGGFLGQESTHRFIEWDLEQFSTMKDVNGSFHHIEMRVIHDRELSNGEIPAGLVKIKVNLEETDLTFLEASERNRIANAHQLFGKEHEIMTHESQRHATPIASIWIVQDDVEMLTFRNMNLGILRDMRAHEAAQAGSVIDQCFLQKERLAKR